MKYEWRKSEKELYVPKKVPTLIEVPPLKFFQISGVGNPNSDAFAEKIGVLYSLAYAVRMMPKNGFTPAGYFEYTVYPLEGIWSLTKEGQKKSILDKDELVYTIMIRQPDFVTKAVAEKAFAIAEKKKPHPLLKEVAFGTIEDGSCLQILHEGLFDTEGESFDKMKAFIEDKGLKRQSFNHREIYLSDFRKTAPEKLKTVLRYFLKD